MTLRELAEIVAASPLPDEAEVVVAGHGALHGVTHAYAEETGRPVLVCYVALPEPPAAGSAGADDPIGPRELSGDETRLAPAEEAAAGIAGEGEDA